MKPIHFFVFISILIVSMSLRLFGIGWDSGTHVHPDERFLTMVITNLEWPKNVQQYFDTDHSPLNPHNKDFSFYVYGTWPIIVAKAVAQALNRDTYDLFPLVGRMSVVFADVATLFTVYLIAFTLTRRTSAALLSMFLYGTSVLPIQIAHFFTVDPFAVLYLTIAIYLLVKKNLGAPLGIIVGLAMGAKISSAIIVPIIAIHYLFAWPWRGKASEIKQERWKLILQGSLFSIALFLTIRIVYPYLFTGVMLNPKVLANWRELATFDGQTTSFPPGLQWIGTPASLYSLKQLIVWGLGIPFSIIFFAAFIHMSAVTLQKKRWNPTIHIYIIIAILFSYQSIQFAKAMRYLAPIYPLIAVVTGIFLDESLKSFSRHVRNRIWQGSMYILIGGILLIWPLMFIAIYRQPNTRVRASDWIYTNVPDQSMIALEHWDDPLPLSRGENSINRYATVQIPMFNQDTKEKWQDITKQLAQSDYIALSSNRVYGGTRQAKSRFLTTQSYYEKLFSGALGFTLVHQEVSRPTFNLPFVHMCIRPPGFTYGSATTSLETCTPNGVSIIDDYADETFTVYDHPKVLIFKNEKRLTANQLFMRIEGN